MIEVAAKSYGSFKDSLQAPIHRWFAYPAGFSYKLVEAKIAENRLGLSSWVADPFVGTGTTSVAAKMAGVNSLGIEAHPFVHWVAKTKLHFSYDTVRLARIIRDLLREAATRVERTAWADIWPPLIYKCFTTKNLAQLAALRATILGYPADEPETDFIRLALTSTLRTVTSAGAGWPYIAPSQYQARVVQRDAFEEFEKCAALMLKDIQFVQWLMLPTSEHALVNGDARRFASYTSPESVDLIITSPPYLNNYDYADRTRLETYFWGIYSTWGDITKAVRDHLMLAATTQVRQSAMNGVRRCPGIAEVDLKLHKELLDIIQRLAVARKTKSGKKTYDSVVAGYFEDMLKVIKGAYTVLKPGGQFVLVLGDSAPYGMYVPTDDYIGRIATSVGFSSYHIQIIRSRGEKWAHNAQRHHVPLHESILTIRK